MHGQTSWAARLSMAAWAVILILAGCRQPQLQSASSAVHTEQVQLQWFPTTKQWKVRLNGGALQNPKHAETIIPRYAAPRMFVVSVIGGGSNPPTFRQNGGLAVWVGSKDTPQAGINSTEIVGPFITGKGKMVFFDLNAGAPVKLNYALYFNEPDVPPVDPIIDNGGGHDF